MRAKPWSIASAGVLAALVILWALPSVAADEPTQPGTTVQSDIKKDTTEAKGERSDIQRETPVSGELGKGSEQPMRVPEISSASEQQTFDLDSPEIYEMLKFQDQQSAVSF
jgi:hypothetical protein